MIETDVTYLDNDGDIEVAEQEPTTIAELTDLLGERLIVELTVANVRYRNKHPRVYRKVSEELSKILPRPQKGEKKKTDGTTKPILVSHLDHCRALYKQFPKETTEAFTRIAQAESLYVKGERSGFGGRISVAALNNANSFFAEGPERVEGIAKVIEETVPGYKVQRDEDDEVFPEALARALMALGKHMKKTAEQQVLAITGKAA